MKKYAEKATMMVARPSYMPVSGVKARSAIPERPLTRMKIQCQPFGHTMPLMKPIPLNLVLVGYHLIIRTQVRLT